MSKIDELLKNEKVEWKKLGEVCQEKFWIMPSTPKFSNDYKIPYITGKNIKNGEIDFDNVKYISEEDFLAFKKNRSINKDDILISMIGTIGEIGIVKGNNKFYGQNLYLLRLNDNIILTRYFYHYFTQNKVKNSLISKKNSSSQGYIRAGNIENLEIPIPSIEIQEKIVKKLDKFTNYVTELQSELQSRTKQYEYYRNMLLSEEYLNKISKKTDGLESKGYKVKFVKLGEIVDIVVGGDVPKDNFSIIPTDKYKIPIFSNGIEENSLYGFTNIAKVDKKSVTISARGTIGYVSYREEPYFPIVRLLCLISRGDIVVKYLYYLLQNSKINHKETGIPSLTTDMIKNIKITLPPIEIQNIVVEILDKFQSLLGDTKGLLPQEIEQRQKQYEYYREKLLTFDVSCAKHTHTHTHYNF
ncbi:restriction endonuclease subunit S [Parvimonas sp. M13]|uniref:restriction endonuclease subunit S n=1 Tax=Parvimonas sp. M13 TaxID=3110694 RepID=UPI002B48D197|nr:restriction endonuclease subunit S [Parvimonas sp. M13]MEB3024849.1 restriction endonuclease subunit S [Parvimonas sp. M13]